MDDGICIDVCIEEIKVSLILYLFRHLHLYIDVVYDNYMIMEDDANATL